MSAVELAADAIRVRDVLRKFRTLAGLSQTRLGAMLGKTARTISRWEHGYPPPRSVRIQLEALMSARPDVLRKLTPAELAALLDQGLLHKEA